MDTNERKHIIRQIGMLELNYCDPCVDKPVSYEHPHAVCKNCQVYQQIREWSYKLGGLKCSDVELKGPRKQRRERKKSIITVEKFVQLRYVEKLSLSEIAEAYGMSPTTPRSWYSRNKELVEEYRKSLEG